jgi:hypothetical protein
VNRIVFGLVVDFERNIRGTENLIFCMGAETDEQCLQMLERINTGDTTISSRNWVPLVIKGIKLPESCTPPNGARLSYIAELGFTGRGLKNT